MSAGLEDVVNRRGHAVKPALEAVQALASPRMTEAIVWRGSRALRRRLRDEREAVSGVCLSETPEAASDSGESEARSRSDRDCNRLSLVL